MGNVLTAHMKHNTTGSNKDEVDHEWNNGTLLGELIEKALLKNTPAQKELQKSNGMTETAYNPVLKKKACCLGLVHDGKRNEDDPAKLPKINAPIANIGVASMGLPKQDGTFNPINDHETLFDSLPATGNDSSFADTKIHSNTFAIKPNAAKWNETSPNNKDMKEIFNSHGMIVKKLKMRDNAGNKLLRTDDCKMKREHWESVSTNSIQEYTPYVEKGSLPGKSFDDSTTEVCDGFFGYYGRQHIRDRQCLVEYEKNGEKRYKIDSDRPGCGDMYENNGKEYKQYVRQDEINYQPVFSYPNDLACLNSPYGSTFTDKNGANVYTAGGVFEGDPITANPLGIDTRCMMNSASEWGEPYALQTHRAEANSAKCVNALVLNDIEAETVNISDINQTNECSANSTETTNETSELDESSGEAEPSSDDPPIENDVAGQEQQDKDERETAENEIAKKNASAPKVAEPTSASAEKIEDKKSISKNPFILYGSGAFLFVCILVFILVLLR